LDHEHVTDTGPAIPARSEEAITMDESTNTATANRYTKWILQGGTAGVSVLVGAALLAAFSPIGAASTDPAPVSAVHERAHQRLDEMGARSTDLSVRADRQRRDGRGEHGGHELRNMDGRRDMRGGPGMQGDQGGHARPAGPRDTDFGGQVAEFLDMDRRQLGEVLRDGASIADLAGDRVDELVADLVARATERIEQAVADGRLDRERADEILAGVEGRANARVNGERPERPGGRERQDGGERNRGSGG
jgi:hypothetical protein